MKFKLGDKTKEIWAGDLVCEYEFIKNISQGRMIFYNLTHKCFHLVYWEPSDNGKFYMNGWNVADSIEELLKKT